MDSFDKVLSTSTKLNAITLAFQLSHPECNQKKTLGQVYYMHTALYPGE